MVTTCWPRKVSLPPAASPPAKSGCSIAVAAMAWCWWSGPTARRIRRPSPSRLSRRTAATSTTARTPPPGGSGSTTRTPPGRSSSSSAWIGKPVKWRSSWMGPVVPSHRHLHRMAAAWLSSAGLQPAAAPYWSRIWRTAWNCRSSPAWTVTCRRPTAARATPPASPGRPTAGSSCSGPGAASIALTWRAAR